MLIGTSNPVMGELDERYKTQNCKNHVLKMIRYVVAQTHTYGSGGL